MFKGSRHLFKNCDSFKKCDYCIKAACHDRCICPKQFSMSSEDPTVSQLFTTNVLDHQGSEDNQSSDTADNDTSLAISANVTSGNDYMLLASRERVLLQTKIVPIYCSDGSVITARVLLDSASQCTFKTDRMAKLLKLSSQRKENFSLYTFGYQGVFCIGLVICFNTLACRSSCEPSFAMILT